MCNCLSYLLTLACTYGVCVCVCVCVVCFVRVGVGVGVGVGASYYMEISYPNWQANIEGMVNTQTSSPYAAHPMTDRTARVSSCNALC